MTFKYSQKRNLEWIRSLPRGCTQVTFTDHNGVEHALKVDVGHNIIIWLDTTWLAYIDRLDSLRTIPEYFHLFPFNRSNRGDFIDTVWYLLNQSLSPLFYTDSGRLSEKALGIFIDRLSRNEFNSVGQNILTRLEDEDSAIWNKIRESVDIELTIMGIWIPVNSRQWGYVRNEEEVESYEEIICNDEVMRNLGYSLEQQENEDDDSEYNEYWVKNNNPAERTATCKCGEVVPKSQIYGNRCSKCITVPKEKLKINSYSEKAERILEFKEKITQKPMESDKNRKKYHEYYQKYLLSIGVSVKGNESSEIYIGAELEYECENKEVAKVEVLELLHEFAILKSDGSLYNGFEIVTMPALYEGHKKYLEPFFNSFPTSLKAESSCGLHFHVSRKPLSLMTQGKLIEFMNREDNGEFLTMLAGRERNSYTPQDNSRTIGYILQGISGDRYNTLNINNPDTLEFRIFSPAITWADYASKMEFCLSLVEYCKPCISNHSIKGKTIKKKDNITTGFKLDPKQDSTYYMNYNNWLKTQKKQYPNLHLKLFGESDKKKKYLESLTKIYADSIAKDTL